MKATGLLYCATVRCALFLSQGSAFERSHDANASNNYDDGINHDQLPLGSIVTLETPHCDPTANLHDYLHIAQRDTLTDIWRIDGRGVL